MTIECCGKPTQRFVSVLDFNHCAVLGHIAGGVDLAHHSTAASLNGFANVVVSIGLLALLRHKECTLASLATVEGHHINLHVGIALLTHNLEPLGSACHNIF